jgi:hypothetical protein
MNINNLLASPTQKEIDYVNSFSLAFLKDLERNPMGAKETFNKVVRPYMEAQLRTINMLDDQIEGTIEQNALLLRSNAVLIDQLKKHGVAMPNFDQVQRDVREELQKESDLGIKRY